MMCNFIVLCDEHGRMEHSATLYCFYCLTCSRSVDDEEVRRLVLAADAPEEELLSIVVT